jgi:signal peptidase I
VKTPAVKPALASHKGEDLAISGEDLQILMREVLAKGAKFHFRAKGWSMSPFIKDGDVITIAPAAQEKPALGKVVAFTQPLSGQLIVHRVIGMQGVAFLIQGDNNAGQADGLVQSGDILGCVTRVERNGRQVYLGLGPERCLIAWLSRGGWLGRLLGRLRAFNNAWKI